jgi:hypothetical protein
MARRRFYGMAAWLEAGAVRTQGPSAIRGSAEPPARWAESKGLKSDAREVVQSASQKSEPERDVVQSASQKPGSVQPVPLETWERGLRGQWNRLEDALFKVRVHGLPELAKARKQYSRTLPSAREKHQARNVKYRARPEIRDRRIAHRIMASAKP